MTFKNHQQRRLVHSDQFVSMPIKTRMRLTAAVELLRAELKRTIHDFGYFRSSQQHADGSNRLARYDFLLVFNCHLGSRWNRRRVRSWWCIIIPTTTKTNIRKTRSSADAETARNASCWTLPKWKITHFPYTRFLSLRTMYIRQTLYRLRCSHVAWKRR